MKKGTLYIISAPSGTGKSTLIKKILKDKFLHNIKASISYTTRKKRPNEVNEKNYFFISKKKFSNMVKKHIFLEYAYIFGHYYGTSKIQIEENINSGIDVLLDIDWQGTKKIQKKISSVYAIFILPPSKNELIRRLHIRGENQEEIKKRILGAINEIKNCCNYDYVIINDNLEIAFENLKSIIYFKRLSSKIQNRKCSILVNQLLIDLKSY